MTRVYLFAEGQTEQTFADTVLQPHLAMHGVYLSKPLLIAHARKKRHTHRGGGRNYTPMKNDIVRLMAQEKKRSDVFFTTMIDLYAIHGDFPGLNEAEQMRHDPYKRVAYLQDAWKRDIADERFIAYIQLHEFETYLFTEPNAFASFYSDSEKSVSNLQKIAAAHKSPELIDDGDQTAPSKRIAIEFPDYVRAKPVIGPQVGQRIGIEAIRNKCPHFDEWVSALEHLGERSAT